MLSTDNEVLDEVYQYHDPPVAGIVRVPVLLWARVKQEIVEYITERKSQGKTTMFWYHRQFIEAAQERYARPEQSRCLHRQLARLFLAGDGFREDVTLSKRNLTVPLADRQVTPQPMTQRNKRLLQALPHHLVGCGDAAFLKQHALCRLDFMIAKIGGCGLVALVRDYQVALEAYPGDEVLETVVRSLQHIRGCSDVRLIQLLPVELLARLRADEVSQPELAAMLGDARRRLERAKEPTLLPVFPCLSIGDAHVKDNVAHPSWFVVPGCGDIVSMSADRTKLLTRCRADGSADHSMCKVLYTF